MRNWTWGIFLFLGLLIAGFVFAVFVKQPSDMERETALDPAGSPMEQEYAVQRTPMMAVSPADTFSPPEVPPVVTTDMSVNQKPATVPVDASGSPAPGDATPSTGAATSDRTLRASVSQNLNRPDDLVETVIPVDGPAAMLALRIRARVDSVLTAAHPGVLPPELTWPDSNRVRRPLTPEIAAQFPADYPGDRYLENPAWHVGERLDFTLDYGIVNAGTATMRVLGTELVNGAVCYHVQSTANSNNVISTFYKVRDVVTTYIDTTGVFSRRFEKQLREGGYKSDRSVDFYMNRRLAMNTREKYSMLTIPPFVQDILSAFYYMRLLDLEVGRDEYVDVYSDGKVYPLRIIVHGIETVTVGAGKFTCFKIEPMLESEGLFRQEGQLFIWLTQDERRLPVKMTSKIAIGSIGANLDKYTLGN